MINDMLYNSKTSQNKLQSNKLDKTALTNTKSKVTFTDKLSEPFDIKTGLHQGDGLSPLLFNYTLKMAMRE